MPGVEKRWGNVDAVQHGSRGLPGRRSAGSRLKLCSTNKSGGGEEHDSVVAWALTKCPPLTAALSHAMHQPWPSMCAVGRRPSGRVCGCSCPPAGHLRCATTLCTSAAARCFTAHACLGATACTARVERARKHAACYGMQTAAGRPKGTARHAAAANGTTAASANDKAAAAAPFATADAAEAVAADVAAQSTATAAVAIVAA
eukprot:364568-Chlamydomonas_euryale.AAC.19